MCNQVLEMSRREVCRNKNAELKGDVACAPWGQLSEIGQRLQVGSSNDFQNYLFF
jgi:hypothetical protein